MHLAIARQQPVGTDQAGCIEDVAGISIVAFEKAAGLDEDAVLAGLALIALGVLVGDRYGELVVQFLDRGINRRGVGELRENDQPHRHERRVAERRPGRSSPACG